MLSHQLKVAKNPKRVVVLGAHGFIAKHLCKWCIDNNIEWIAIGRKDIDLSVVDNAPKLAALLRPSDSVVMTSSLTPENGKDCHTLIYNLRIAQTVALALNDKHCAHFIYLSSDAVYDADKTPLDEDSSREPTDLYALSHTGREMIFTTELSKLSIPCCLLRLTSIYGPGDTHNAYGPNRFVRSAINEGQISLFGKGEELRSYVLINDLVKIISLVLSKCSTGTLNVAIKPAISFAKLAKIIVQICEKPIVVKNLPRQVPVIHRPYKLTQVFRFIYNMGRPIGQIVHRSYMNAAVYKAFPDFNFTPLETGLAQFIEFEKNICKQ